MEREYTSTNAIDDAEFHDDGMSWAENDMTEVEYADL